MADLTITELAKMVGVPVDRLLEQVKEAGLPQTGADDSMNNDERMTLLKSLKGKHGDSEPATQVAPKRISLKRKTLGTLKSTDNQGRSKSVTVEVRKKRTYVKRSVEEAQIAEAAKQKELAELKAKEDQEKAEREAAEAAQRAQEVKAGSATPPAAAPSSDGGADSRRKGTLKKGSFGASSDKKSNFRSKDKVAGGGRRFGRGKSNDEFVLSGGESGGSRRRGRKKLSQSTEHQFEKPVEFIAKEIQVPEAISVSDLAQRMSLKGAELVKTLMNMGVMANINLVLDQDTSILLVEELGHIAKPVSDDALEEDLVESIVYEGEELTRAPVITVMGHVDHGKTSLLDYIRKSTVTDAEAGGITQHIGAYHVNTPHGMISFLDTPGHAAFSAMRSRGAKATDIVILVVAGDDGMKPQTEEAVQHAAASGVPVVVAINKMDKEGADPERVKNELAAKGLAPEEWGGETQFIEVSALTGQGIPELLEAVSLQAELLELKAVVDCPAKGVVIESRLDKGRGPVATVLVQNGTLKVGDIVLMGHEYGRVRALLDENGKQTKTAGPSIPVEVLGLNGTPDAGDEFFVVNDEKRAREVAEFRRHRFRESQIAKQQIAKMESMFATMGKDNIQILNVVLKTDVRGSLEAITGALMGLATDEVMVNVVSSGVGGISETDVQLAASSKATIFGFNVRADKSARNIVEREGLEMRYYSVIYNLIDDVKAVLGGMLAPEVREEILGVAEVKEVFTSPKFGLIAGSIVLEGTIYRNRRIRVLREDVVIYEGELESLRRFKDEANEVRSGMECGIGVKDYTDVKVGDKIEVYQTTEIARTLD